MRPVFLHMLSYLGSPFQFCQFSSSSSDEETEIE